MEISELKVSSEIKEKLMNVSFHLDGLINGKPLWQKYNPNQLVNTRFSPSIFFQMAGRGFRFKG